MDWEQILVQGLMMVLPTLGGSIIGSIIGSYKSHNAKNRAIEDYNKISMKRDLREIHRRVCVERSGCTVEDKEDAEEIYTAYKALGGNGTGETLYREIMAAAVTG